MYILLITKNLDWNFRGHAQYSREHHYFMCPKGQVSQSSIHNYNSYRPCLIGWAIIITERVYIY